MPKPSDHQARRQDDGDAGLGRTHSDELIWDMVFLRKLPALRRPTDDIEAAPRGHDELMKEDGVAGMTMAPKAAEESWTRPLSPTSAALCLRPEDLTSRNGPPHVGQAGVFRRSSQIQRR